MQTNLRRNTDGFMLLADFCDENTSENDHKTGLSSCKSIYCPMQQTDLDSLKCSVVWTYSKAECFESSVRYLPVSINKAATLVNSNGLVVYPVHFVLVSCSGKFNSWLIEIGRTVVGSWQVRGACDLIVSRFKNGSHLCTVAQAQMRFMPGNHGEALYRKVHDRRYCLH